MSSRTAGEREALVAGGVVLRPGANIKVVIAPGVILEKEHELDNELHEVETSDEGGSREVRFVGRLGVGYSIEVSSAVLTPIVYFDLLEGVHDGD